MWAYDYDWNATGEFCSGKFSRQTKTVEGDFAAGVGAAGAFCG
jgi:hypothetical protein